MYGKPAMRLRWCDGSSWRGRWAMQAQTPTLRKLVVSIYRTNRGRYGAFAWNNAWNTEAFRVPLLLYGFGAH